MSNTRNGCFDGCYFDESYFDQRAIFPQILLDVGAIASLEAFGVASIIGSTWLYPDGVPSAEVIGAQQVLPGQVPLGVIAITSLESFGNSLVGKALHPLGGFLPTGHNDPGASWEDEANAYDGNIGTYAKEVIS